MNTLNKIFKIRFNMPSECISFINKSNNSVFQHKHIIVGNENIRIKRVLSIDEIFEELYEFEEDHDINAIPIIADYLGTFIYLQKKDGKYSYVYNYNGKSIFISDDMVGLLDKIK